VDNINFYTPGQAMDALNISYPTLIRRVKANKIPYIRIGRSLRFPRSYFEQLEREAMESTGRVQADD
jgi:excisionase family DNA binding protein